jgi:hypothetical protein
VNPDNISVNGAALEEARTQIDDVEAATKAAPIRKPLTKAQRDFLTSAVSTTK